MKQIQTGKGTIPLLTFLTIWSVSLVINLPPVVNVLCGEGLKIKNA